jgi:hypothetical protein
LPRKQRQALNTLLSQVVRVELVPFLAAAALAVFAQQQVFR